MAWLGNESACKHLATQFGVSEFTFIRCTEHVVDLLLDKAGTLVKFPRKEDMRRKADEFDEIGRFYPNVIGAIDGMHVAVRVSRKDKGSFYNFKAFHSVQLQAICDAKLLVTDFFVGSPGRVHSGGVFRDSPLAEIIHEAMHVEGLPLEETFTIVADSAYQCTEHVTAAFKVSGRNNTDEIKKFNRHLASKRQVIERCFSFIKRRWCRLNDLRCRDMAKNINAISAAVVLHNWCLMMEDFDENDDDFNFFPHDIPTPPHEGLVFHNGNDETGRVKRILLVDIINNH